MKVSLLLCNKENGKKQWVKFPMTNKKLTIILNSLDNEEIDNIEIIDSVSKLDLDFTEKTDLSITDLNRNVREWNKYYTDNEMIAFSEVCESLSDMIYENPSEFYEGKKIEDLAYEWANKRRYRHYKNPDGSVDIEEIAMDLVYFGYDETSKGVVLPSWHQYY